MGLKKPDGNSARPDGDESEKSGMTLKIIGWYLVETAAIKEVHPGS
jgi:hypothetical protein